LRKKKEEIMNLLTYRCCKIKVKTIFFLPIVALLLFFSGTANSHNLWIVGDANNKGDGAIHLYFEHHVGPGDGAYLGPIEERGKTWLITPKGAPAPIALEAVKVNETKFLAGKIGNTAGSYGIDHTSLYGIYHGRLDFFHGRYIEAINAEGLSALAESPQLPVQIVPIWTDAGLLLRVMYFSTPRPRADLFILKKDGTEKGMKADNKGEYLVGKITPGTYFISTRIIESEPAGAFEYQAYKGIMHVSTLALKISEGFKE
jgi:hypothetical protein